MWSDGVENPSSDLHPQSREKHEKHWYDNASCHRVPLMLVGPKEPSEGGSSAETPHGLVPVVEAQLLWVRFFGIGM